jgi:hypothetical protein
MAGQLCPLCARPIEPGENVAFREGTLRHLRCTSDGVRPGRLAETPADGLPRCGACDQPVTVGEDVVFLPSGLVEHVHCPSLKCAACTALILRDEVARWFRGEAFHESCWAQRPRTIAGGACPEPWTLIFDRRLALRAATDPAAHRELLAVSREVRSRCRDAAAQARSLRASLGRRRSAPLAAA